MTFKISYSQRRLLHNLNGNLLTGSDVNRQFDFGEAAATNRLLQIVQSFKGGISHHRETRAREIQIINNGNLSGSHLSIQYRNRPYISTFLNRGKQLFAANGDLALPVAGAHCQ